MNLSNGSDANEITDRVISLWVSQLYEGDQHAANLLWNQFANRLVRIARDRLRTAYRAVSDEEDVVSAAFKSFFCGIQNGQYKELTNIENVWRLLLTIMLRKIADKHEYDHRSKRDVARMTSYDANDLYETLTNIVSRERSPEIAAQITEQLDVAINSLGNLQLKQLAVLKLEGHTNQEIAQIMECSLTSIERGLRKIRLIWTQSGLQYSTQRSTPELPGHDSV